MKQLVVVLILFLCYSKGFGQLDSLRNELNNSKDDSALCSLLNKIAWAYTRVDLDSAKQFADFPDDEIIVISSDFHIERVSFIFSRLYPTRQFTFIGSYSEISESERNRLIKHEKLALVREKLSLKSL